MNLTYTNPIIDRYLADPCLVWDEGEQAYFLFATGPTREDGRAIPVYRSPDLVHWTFVRGAVARGATKDAWNFTHFWAPEVIRIGDTYHLYYTASPEDSPKNSGNRVGLAVSKSIAGPYEDAGVVVPHGSIDGHPFIDDDGGFFLFYTIEHLNADGLVAGQIYMDRMLDPRTVARDPKPVITHHEWQEGPWLLKRGGRYFLAYSCGGWTGADYHVRWAVGDSPSGPFTEQESRILESTDAVKGPGHHSMFQDRKGRDWICYHGWDPAFTARYPRIDRIYFEEGRMRSDGPTSSPQPVHRQRIWSGTHA
ncbi:family 43 glycosylhydrolase [bacterium]|nr:family 43 glycosylhydrolase [bacterium]